MATQPPASHHTLAPTPELTRDTLSQAAPKQWASFHPSRSGPNAADSKHSTCGLHQSHSAGLAAQMHLGDCQHSNLESNAFAQQPLVTGQARSCVLC